VCIPDGRRRPTSGVLALFSNICSAHLRASTNVDSFKKLENPPFLPFASLAILFIINSPLYITRNRICFSAKWTNHDHKTPQRGPTAASTLAEFHKCHSEASTAQDALAAILFLLADKKGK
jgi:hypothetical protein